MSETPTSKQNPEEPIRIRSMQKEDVHLLQQALFLMVAWDPARELPPMEVVVDHPELARYHRNWGRPGDMGLVAERNGEFAGAVFCRLFTADDHGHGFVDPETPEMGVAVVPEHRGVGLGTALMEELARGALAAGVSRLSLSVDLENPAVHLYRRLGYEEVSRDEGGLRMVLTLKD